jgi:insulysin
LGNVEGIREKLIDFYSKYYSSNLMNVVIYGVEDISILQNYAIEFFWKVKNLQIARPVYT